MTGKKFLSATICPFTFAAFLAFSSLASEPVTEAAAEGTKTVFSIADYGSGESITEEEGIALAYEHAGITQDKAEHQHSEYDRDDGMSILEIEFEVAGDEYEYEIDLDGGRILSASYEMSDRRKREFPLLTTSISDSEAAALVLEKVPGVAADDMWNEADRDDGILYYEIDFIHEGIEYEFEVDADAGMITSWEQEWITRR